MKLKFTKTHLEFLGIAFGIVISIVYPLMANYSAIDFDKYLSAAKGEEFTHFFYMQWIIPFFIPLTYLPYQLAFIIFNLISLAGFLWALHVFKGNKLFFFTSYPFLFLVFYGQIEGILIGCLTWMYLALQRQDWKQASIAWLIALTKLHIGFSLGLGLLWLYANNQTRLKVVASVIAMFLLSNVIWPLWIFDWFERVTGNNVVGPNDIWSVDAWQYTGPFILLLWLPIIFSQNKNFRWFVATCICTAPYWHTYSLTIMQVFPLGLVGWIFNLGYLNVFGAKLHSGPIYLIAPLWIYLSYWRESWPANWPKMAIVTRKTGDL